MYVGFKLVDFKVARARICSTCIKNKKEEGTFLWVCVCVLNYSELKKKISRRVKLVSLKTEMTYICILLFKGIC